MRIFSDLAATIGNTPLLRLKKASALTGCDCCSSIAAKKRRFPAVGCEETD